MILYKYLPYDAGNQVIENSSVGFSQPVYFNDPFELSAGYPSTESNDKLLSIMDAIRRDAKIGIWSWNTAILALTRSPLNPLMWAHYAASHEGFVVGIDVAAAGFTCVESNLVPAHFGSVIYTATKPDNQYLSTFTIPLQVGGTFHFQQDHLEKLQRIFLHKPMDWAYEEEVRIVKCIDGINESLTLPSGTFTEKKVGPPSNQRRLFLLELPPGAIREIYIGIRNQDASVNGHERLLNRVGKFKTDVSVYQCDIAEKSWTLEAVKVKGNADNRSSVVGSTG